MMQIKSPQDVAFVLVSYLPVPGTVGEMKTKPTQYAIRTMNASGLNPDFIICRPPALDEPRKEKFHGGNNKARYFRAQCRVYHEIPLMFDKKSSILKSCAFELPPQKSTLEMERLSKKVASCDRYYRKYLTGDSYADLIFRHRP